MSAITMLVGVIVLLFGRRMFWLVVAAAGFIAGMVFTHESFHVQPAWGMILLMLAAGLIGALLALFLQKVAVALAGVFIGGCALMGLAALWGGGAYEWLAFVVGGVLGAVLVFIVFDSALIILSSLAGAILITQALEFDRTLSAVCFVLALIAGMIFQFRDARSPGGRHAGKHSVHAGNVPS